MYVCGCVLLEGLESILCCVACLSLLYFICVGMDFFYNTCISTFGGDFGNTHLLVSNDTWHSGSTL